MPDGERRLVQGAGCVRGDRDGGADRLKLRMHAREVYEVIRTSTRRMLACAEGSEGVVVVWDGVDGCQECSYNGVGEMNGGRTATV